MANELVRTQGWPKETIQDEWDRPPLAENSRHRPMRQDGAARSTQQEATQAYTRGDGAFASQRQTDAGEKRQRQWDWGDARTWVWIASMCLGFLALVALVYFLPYGRHNQTDGPMPTPTIRVY